MYEILREPCLPSTQESEEKKKKLRGARHGCFYYVALNILIKPLHSQPIICTTPRAIGTQPPTVDEWVPEKTDPRVDRRMQEDSLSLCFPTFNSMGVAAVHYR